MRGEELREIIKGKNVRLVDVANHLGISPQHLESKFRAKDLSYSFVIKTLAFIGATAPGSSLSTKPLQEINNVENDVNTKNIYELRKKIDEQRELIDNLRELKDVYKEKTSDLEEEVDELLAILKRNGYDGKVQKLPSHKGAGADKRRKKRTSKGEGQKDQET